MSKDVKSKVTYQLHFLMLINIKYMLRFGSNGKDRVGKNIPKMLVLRLKFNFILLIIKSIYIDVNIIMYPKIVIGPLLLDMRSKPDVFMYP